MARQVKISLALMVFAALLVARPGQAANPAPGSVLP
jgi:hypothetical protein